MKKQSLLLQKRVFKGRAIWEAPHGGQKLTRLRTAAHRLASQGRLDTLPKAVA